MISTAHKIVASMALVFACLIYNGGAVGQPSPPSVHRGTLTIEAGSGDVVVLPSVAANVFVADPKVAEVKPASPTSLFVSAISVGRTTIAAMDAAGNLIAQYRLTVRPSLFAAIEAQDAIARLLPGGRVKAQAQATGLLLSGQVDSPADAAQAMAIARGYLSEKQVVENQITIQSSIQVTLRVRIAEMSREVVRNLGINWQAIGTIGNIGRFPALSLVANAAVAPACLAGAGCQGVGFNGIIDALAKDNLAHILAEPNLTVMSGQPASFLVGGEFPIPVGQQQGQVTIEFKKYGITLAFLPTVYSDGRINLHVSPEVSQLTNQGSVQLTAGNSTIQIPALLVRRAETTVELGSGESFAIAGLLQDTSTQGMSGLPYLGDLPVLGALFRSSAFQRNETELVILVTPLIVRPVKNEASLRLPTDGFTPASDLDRILFSRQLGRSKPGKPVQRPIPGDAGFMMQ